MKPTSHRNASSVMIFNKKGAVMMDCAEGTYSQLVSHLGSQERVDRTLIRLRCLYITHLHGDHQYGMFKMIYARDQALKNLKESERTKFYIVVPAILIPQIKFFVN